MPNNISKDVTTSLLPEGPIWVSALGQDFDKFLDGKSENAETMREFLSKLSDIRNPLKTTILEDLEKEFGVGANLALTEAERRAQLLAVKTASNGDGTDTFLEDKLQLSGFDLFVYQNDPPVDPDTILSSGFLMFCDSDEAFCGHEDALCGKESGQLLVNNIPFIDSTFTVPVASDTWPSIFFIGGVATRDPGTNEILSILPAQIPISRSNELLRLIVKYKPFHTWCGLLVQFI